MNFLLIETNKNFYESSEDFPWLPSVNCCKQNPTRSIDSENSMSSHPSIAHPHTLQKKKKSNQTEQTNKIHISERKRLVESEEEKINKQTLQNSRFSRIFSDSSYHRFVLYIFSPQILYFLSFFPTMRGFRWTAV